MNRPTGPDGKPLTEGAFRKLLQEEATRLLAEHRNNQFNHRRNRKKKIPAHQRASKAPHQPANSWAPHLADDEARSFVYAIGAVGYPVKIGIAGDVKKRLAGLQTAFPVKLKVYGKVLVSLKAARVIEREAHRLLRDNRLNGEWFNVTGKEALSLINRLARTSELRPATLERAA